MALNIVWKLWKDLMKLVRKDLHLSDKVYYRVLAALDLLDRYTIEYRTSLSLPKRPIERQLKPSDYLVLIVEVPITFPKSFSCILSEFINYPHRVLAHINRVRKNYSAGPFQIIKESEYKRMIREKTKELFPNVYRAERKRKEEARRVRLEGRKKHKGY